MRSVLTLICGTIVVASVYMPWFNVVDKLKFSGWDVTNGDLSGWIGTGGPLLAFIGGWMMIAFVLCNFVLPRIVPTTSVTYAILPVLVRTGAGLAMFGATWALIDGTTDSAGSVDLWDRVMYGVWIAAVAGTIGLFAGLSRPSVPWRKHGVEFVPEEAVSVSAPVRARIEDIPSAIVRPQEDPVEEVDRAVPTEIAKHYFDRAIDCESASNFEEAIEQYDRAIRADPSYALAYYNRGSVHLRQGNTTAALEDFRKVLEVAADEYLTHTAQSRIDELTGRSQPPDEAMA